MINSYKENFSIDTSHTLSGESVGLYCCKDTGYRFFYPYDIAGDGKFYEQLQEYDWYYMSWKWEHEKALTYIESEMKILEVGCAQGSFLKKVQEEYQAVTTGLELNEKAVAEANSKGIEVYAETVQDHVKDHREKYDLVCSFQVLEHISDVKSFIQAQIDVLKSGGKLLACVPNNNSFIQYQEGGLLNFPPHHMGWWNEDSLANIEKVFPLKLVDCLFEPLQPQHIDWYTSIVGTRFFEKPILGSLFYRFRLREVAKKIVDKFSHKIKGHSILAIYEKL